MVRAILRFCRRVRSLGAGRRRDRELDDEIGFHVEMRTADNIASGMAPEEARRAALVQFGSGTLMKEDSRAVWGLRFFDTLRQDLRYAVRTLGRNPGFAAAAILTLALGIGVNTSAFTLLNAALLRGLPVKDPETMIKVSLEFRGEFSREVHGSWHLLSYPEYLEFRDHTPGLSGLAAYLGTSLTLGSAEPESVRGCLVSGEYFDLLGGAAALGRTFSPAEASTPGREPVAVLSHGFWQRRFGGDPRVVGSTLVLNRQLFTVVGVAAVDFRGAETAIPDVWLPLTMQREVMPGRDWLLAPNSGWLEAVGRRRPGVLLRRIEAEMSVVARRMDQAYPGRTTRVHVTDGSLASEPAMRAKVWAVMAAVMTAVGFVLLTACANVAGLLLARASARGREIAVRLSIGASRARLVRQLVTESSLLALLGGGLGLGLSFFLPNAVLRIFPLGGSPSFDTSPDLGVVGFALAVSLGTGVLFGLAPALEATRLDLVSALKTESALLGSRLRPSRIQRVLVGVQVALSFVLLVTAGLVVRGIQAAYRLDPGFEVRNVFVVALDLQALGYTDATAAALRDELIKRAGGLPGVRGVAEVNVIPLTGRGIANVALAERPESGSVEVSYNAVSPSYFATLRVPILRGRGFAAAEARGEELPAVVSETMARRFWPGQDPIGRRFRAGSVFEVVGVARDTRSAGLTFPDLAYFYKPITRERLDAKLVVRAEGDAAAIASGLRQAVAALEPKAAVSVRTLGERLEQEVAESRVLAWLASGLGMLALGLAAVGISGLVAFASRLRTREIGVRIALGAERSHIVLLVLGQGMIPVGVGLAAGVALSAAVSRLLVRKLYGLSPLDPTAFAAVSLFLLSVAAVAGYIPARRAARVDPIEALHYE